MLTVPTPPLTAAIALIITISSNITNTSTGAASAAAASTTKAGFILLKYFSIVFYCYQFY